MTTRRLATLLEEFREGKADPADSLSPADISLPEVVQSIAVNSSRMFRAHSTQFQQISRAVDKLLRDLTFSIDGLRDEFHFYRDKVRD